MSDLKWVTLSFIQNLIETISRDKDLALEQKKSLLESAQKILFETMAADSDEEAEQCHEAFHRIKNKLCALSLRLSLIRNNKIA